MGLNDTVSADRPHIGFFGLRNAGKSSVVNAVSGQNLSVVSEIKGTTTDPVQKAMELLPAGPVVVIDTPGMDDTGRLGEERIRRARRVLDRTDVAILVVDGTIGLQPADHELIRLFDDRRIPYIIAYNKCDLLEALPQASENEIYVSAAEGTNIWTLKERIAQLANRETSKKMPDRRSACARRSGRARGTGRFGGAQGAADPAAAADHPGYSRGERSLGCDRGGRAAAHACLFAAKAAARCDGFAGIRCGQPRGAA